MEMRQFSYFVEIAQCGSFSGAAKTLSIAQPALSRQIRLLEKSLGEPLLYRNGRGITMTAAGEIFLAPAREVLTRVERSKRDVAALRGTPCGEVVLGLPPSISSVLLKRVVIALAERYPLVRLKIQEGFSGAVAEWLLAGKVDLAIIYGRHSPQTAHAEPLLVEELPLVHSPTMVLPPAITSAALAKIPLVLPARPSGLRLIVERRMAEQGGSIDIRFEMDSLTLMKDLAIEGIVATILPAATVAREVAEGLLCVTPILSPAITRVMTLAVAAGSPLENCHRAVMRVIREVADAEQGRQAKPER
jgi:LysR family nitrogen assimilation transcriptional regulator